MTTTEFFQTIMDKGLSVRDAMIGALANRDILTDISECYGIDKTDLLNTVNDLDYLLASAGVWLGIDYTSCSSHLPDDQDDPEEPTDDEPTDDEPPMRTT